MVVYHEESVCTEACNWGWGDSSLVCRSKHLKTWKHWGLYTKGEDLSKLGDTHSYGKGKGNKANTWVKKRTGFVLFAWEPKWCHHATLSSVKRAALDILTSQRSGWRFSPHPYLPTFPYLSLLTFCLHVSRELGSIQKKHISTAPTRSPQCFVCVSWKASHFSLHGDSHPLFWPSTIFLAGRERFYERRKHLKAFVL